MSVVGSRLPYRGVESRLTSDSNGRAIGRFDIKHRRFLVLADRGEFDDHLTVAHRCDLTPEVLETGRRDPAGQHESVGGRTQMSDGGQLVEAIDALTAGRHPVALRADDVGDAVLDAVDLDGEFDQSPFHEGDGFAGREPIRIDEAGGPG